MNLPPLAPGRLSVGSDAELMAYLDRYDQVKFERLVRHVAGLGDHGARSAFLQLFARRHSEAEVERLRRAAWALINPDGAQERPLQDYVSQLEELFE